jgi:hypothetical protein
VSTKPGQLHPEQATLSAYLVNMITMPRRFGAWWVSLTELDRSRIKWGVLPSGAIAVFAAVTGQVIVAAVVVLATAVMTGWYLKTISRRRRGSLG